MWTADPFLVTATWCQPESVTVVLEDATSATVASRRTSLLEGLNMTSQPLACCDATAWLLEPPTTPRWTQASSVKLSPTSSDVECGTLTSPVEPLSATAVSGSPLRAPSCPSV